MKRSKFSEIFSILYPMTTQAPVIRFSARIRTVTNVLRSQTRKKLLFQKYNNLSQLSYRILKETIWSVNKKSRAKTNQFHLLTFVFTKNKLMRAFLNDTAAVSTQRNKL
jgi:hypothetical protein